MLNEAVTKRIKFYQTDLDQIPEKHKEMFAAMNEAIKFAFYKAEHGIKSLTQYNAGYCFVKQNENGVYELIEIRQYRQDAPEGLHGWWIAAEANNTWYGDAAPTLNDIKIGLLGD